MSDEEAFDDDELEEDDLEETTTTSKTKSPAKATASSVPARATPSSTIARHLVDDPDGVFVDASERGDTVTLLVHASPGDLGRIIGKRGRVIQSMRQVARAAGSTEGVRVTVDVAE